MSLHSSISNSHPLRLSQRRQLTILAAVGGGALVLVVAVTAFGRLTAHAEAPASPGPPGVFRPTPAQWQGFEVRPVQPMSFQDEQDTDGKISTNDDRTTPVFSPYTGRVTRVLAYPGRIFHAKVTYIAPAVDPTARRLVVRAEIANADRALKPEMFADFGIDTGPASSALAVPEDAVIYEGQSAHVWLARPGHSLALQQVRLGRSSGGLVEVLDGLRPGDQVATSGALFLDRAVRAG